jgi:hypothetical protein
MRHPFNGPLFGEAVWKRSGISAATGWGFEILLVNFLGCRSAFEIRQVKRPG